MTMPLLLEHFDDLLVTPENAIQLNHAVLQLAIQGKLVEQNPKDESVKSVLKRLLNWNEENFSNSATELEKPFDIPESWEWRTIGDVCQTTSGGTPSRQNPNYYGGNIPWLKSGELEDTLIEQIEEAITDEGLANSSAKIFPAGTPLIALYGATVGKTGMLGVDAATNQAVCALFPAKEIIDTHFLLKYLQSQRQKLLDISAGGAQPNISQKVIREWLIPIPPLAEQQRIVARVEELFAQTRALAQELAHSQSELDGLNQSSLSHLLASETPKDFNQHWDFIAEHFDLLFQTPEQVAPLRQSILELAVRGKLTRREAGDEAICQSLDQIRKEKKDIVLPPISKSEQLFELPHGWEWERLAVVAVKTQDGTHYSPQVQHAKKEKNTYLYITSKNIKIDGVNLSNVTYIDEDLHKQIYQRCNPEKGDVLLIKDGAMTGMVTINNLDEEFSLLSSVALIKTEKRVLLPRFLMYFLRSPSGLESILGNMSGSAIRRIVMRQLDKTLVAIPPLAEQERIVKRVEQLLSLCDALEARLQSAEEERGRLVAAVMSTVGG
jgi:type I restriction enzyme, S subunit